MKTPRTGFAKSKTKTKADHAEKMMREISP